MGIPVSPTDFVATMFLLTKQVDSRFQKSFYLNIIHHYASNTPTPQQMFPYLRL